MPAQACTSSKTGSGSAPRPLPASWLSFRQSRTFAMSDADVFYRERDQRSLECGALTEALKKPVTVVVGNAGATTRAGQMAVLGLANLLPRVHRYGAGGGGARAAPRRGAGGGGGAAGGGAGLS